MNGTRRLTRTAATTVLITMIVASCWPATAGTAAARPIPLPARFGPPTPPAPVTVITHSNSPWWTFLIVAMTASALTLIATAALVRLRHRPGARQA